MRKVKILPMLLVLFVSLSSAVDTSKVSANTSSLGITGHVFDKGEKVDGALVKLYQNNTVVQITETKKSEFQFILFSGILYMVEIHKPGSITERIQISTEEDTQFGGKYLYELNVNLMSIDKIKGVDMSELDFPTAIVKYDKDEGEYMHDTAYRRKVKLNFKELKQQAQVKR